MFDVTRIRELTHLEHVEVHQQLDSTNDRALELVRTNAVKLPALVVALKQTAGRGQRDRKWWSSTGSLTFSWIAPPIVANDQGSTKTQLIPIATALAVAESIENLTGFSSVEIKWPNDLTMSGRKLGGILVETVSKHPTSAIVVGIGINVNNEKVVIENDCSSEGYVRSSVEPTSLIRETLCLTPLEDLLIEIVDKLGREFEFASINPASIINRCQSRLAFVGQTIQVILPKGKTEQGTLQGITIDGGLILDSESGLKTVYSGSIFRV